MKWIQWVSNNSMFTIWLTGMNVMDWNQINVYNMIKCNEWIRNYWNIYNMIKLINAIDLDLNCFNIYNWLNRINAMYWNEFNIYNMIK